MSLPIGSQKIVADGVVGVSGTPTRVFGFIVNANSSGTVVAVHNGTSGSDPAFDSLVGAASVSTRISYPGGLFFPSGCYLNVDSNTTYVVIIYSQEG